MFNKKILLRFAIFFTILGSIAFLSASRVQAAEIQNLIGNASSTNFNSRWDQMLGENLSGTVTEIKAKLGRPGQAGGTIRGAITAHLCEWNDHASAEGSNDCAGANLVFDSTVTNTTNDNIYTFTATPYTLNPAKVYTLVIGCTSNGGCTIWGSGSDLAYNNAQVPYSNGYHNVNVAGFGSTNNSPTGYDPPGPEPSLNQGTDSAVHDIYFALTGSSCDALHNCPTLPSVDSSITMTFPTMATTTARIGDITFDYTADHVFYPKLSVDAFIGTDPTHLAAYVGAKYVTDTSNASSTYIALYNVDTLFQVGTTYYATLMMYQTDTLAGGPFNNPAGPTNPKYLARTPVISFTITAGATYSPGSVPPEVVGSGGQITLPTECTNSGTAFSVFSGTDWKCLVLNTFNSILLSVEHVGDAAVIKARDAVLAIFPLSAFKAVNDDITAISVTTTPYELTLVGHGKVFPGRTFVLLNASTTEWIQTGAGWDYKSFFDKIMYFATGLIIIGEAAALIRKIHDSVSQNTSG